MLFRNKKAIELIDEDNGDSYYAEFHSTKRNKKLFEKEEFISKGWYKYTKRNKIRRDHEFMRKYNDELRKSGTVLNNQGVHQKVIFNKVRDHPMIISGWPLLKAYYNLPFEVVVEIVITATTTSE
ncbi:hypothetical protein RYX36_002070 [Vicia faba]